MNFEGYCGLKVIMMHQCKFIRCNKCPTLVEDIDNRAGLAYVVHGEYGKSQWILLSIAVNLKLLLKSQSLKILYGNPRTSNSENYFLKIKVGGFKLSDFKIYYEAIAIKIIPSRKRSKSRLYIVSLLFWTSMQSTSWETLGWKKHKLESRLLGKISITSDMQMTPSLWQKVKKN